MKDSNANMTTNKDILFLMAVWDSVRDCLLGQTFSLKKAVSDDEEQLDISESESFKNVMLSEDYEKLVLFAVPEDEYGEDVEIDNTKISYIKCMSILINSDNTCVLTYFNGVSYVRYWITISITTDDWY